MAYMPRQDYTHIQSVLATVWTVQHDLGRRPVVQVEDATGTLLYGTVQHIDDSMLTITFAIAITGRATCT